MIYNDEVVSYALLKRYTKPFTVVIVPRNQAAVQVPQISRSQTATVAAEFRRM